MDIKEIGTCAVIVIGGVAYTVSSGGLKDALSDDIRHVSEITYAERADYMNEIVDQFTNTFDVYIVQTENYDYVGHSEFSAAPKKATFLEVVTAEDSVPKSELANIRAKAQTDFCAQEEMLMFTSKGWKYKFTLKDDQGRNILTNVCKPDANYGIDKNKAVG